jgi:hypothetical protein
MTAWEGDLWEETSSYGVEIYYHSQQCLAVIAGKLKNISK